MMGKYTIYNTALAKKQKEVICMFAIIGLLLHIIGTYTLSITAGEIQTLYKGYNNLPCVLYTFGVFISLNDIAKKIENIKWLKKVIEAMGKYTFAVYLMHWFVLRLLERMPVISTKVIIYRLFMPYAVYAVIMLVTWCLRRVPIISKIVP